MSRPRVSSVLLVAVVAAVAMAGCGGKTFVAGPSGDLALARRSVLTAADVPDYTASPHTESDDTPAAEKRKFATCLGTTTTIFDDVPGAQKADSPDFTRGANDESEISNSVEIDPHTRDIDNAWSTLSASRAAGCLQKFFESALADQAAPAKSPTLDVGLATVVRFEPGIGDRSVGYAMKFSATIGTVSLTSYIDLVFVARDRAGLEFDFVNLGAPTSRDVEVSLARKVYDRIGTRAQ